MVTIPAAKFQRFSKREFPHPSLVLSFSLSRSYECVHKRGKNENYSILKNYKSILHDCQWIAIFFFWPTKCHFTLHKNCHFFAKDCQYFVDKFLFFAKRLSLFCQSIVIFFPTKCHFNLSKNCHIFVKTLKFFCHCGNWDANFEVDFLRSKLSSNGVVNSIYDERL